MAADPSSPHTPAHQSRFAWPRSAQAAAALLIGISLVGLAGFAWRPGRPASLSAAPASLDLNTATRADLVLLPGVGEQMAERIAAYREDNGPFKSLDELRKVPGVGPVTLDRLRPWLRVGDAGAESLPDGGVPIIRTPPIAKATKLKAGDGTNPIDLNSASAEELQRLPGIGPKLSKRIVEERFRKRFEEIADLRRVSGIGPKTFEKVRPFITVAP